MAPGEDFRINLMERFPVKTKDTAHRKLEDEALVVHFRSSFFYNFNPVAARIWECCDGQHSVPQIAAELAEEYDVTLEEATRDCQEFIEGLAAEGLLEWREG
jgi:hypothetical protein